MVDKPSITKNIIILLILIINMNNITKALMDVTLFKGLLVIGMLTILNFIYHCSRIYYKNPKKEKEDEANAYFLANKNNKEGTNNNYVSAISLFKEIYLFLIEIILVVVTLFTNQSIFKGSAKYLVLTMLPFLKDRYDSIVNDGTGFIESKEIQNRIKKVSILEKIIYVVGYLIMPFTLLYLRNITNNIGLNYLYVGVVFMLINRLFNLTQPATSNLSSESLWGSLIEAYSYGLPSGAFYFSSSLSDILNKTFNTPYFLQIYSIVAFVIFFLIFYFVRNSNKD